MKWYIICPIRGLIHTFNDDYEGHKNVIDCCRDLADDIKAEGFGPDSIICIRGEKYQMVPPSKDYQLIKKGD